MTREDALYQKLLLAAGFWELYEPWLAEFVEKEDPLSDLALDLSWCGGNHNEIVSCLHRYTIEGEVDEAVVAERLRQFVKERHEKGLLTVDGCMSAFYRFASKIELLVHPSWKYMMYLSDYYELVTEGWYPEKLWSKAIYAFLNDGIMSELKSKYIDIDYS
ncbi:MAG: hypothetical protein IJX76_10435 [Clostridia bacterium]|nr:hypothetical protein [Clostridia bacterium]